MLAFVFIIIIMSNYIIPFYSAYLKIIKSFGKCLSNKKYFSHLFTFLRVFQ